MDGSAFRIAGLSFLNPEPGRLQESIRNLRGSPCFRSMRPWLSELEAALGEPGLEQEFRRLFGIDAVCPPYKATRTRGGATLIPEDHAGLLLIGFSQLLERNAPPLELLRFWTEHLEWLPDFCREVELRARHPYYRVLGAWVRDGLLQPAAAESAFSCTETGGSLF